MNDQVNTVEQELETLKAFVDMRLAIYDEQMRELKGKVNTHISSNDETIAELAEQIRWSFTQGNKLADTGIALRQSIDEVEETTDLLDDMLIDLADRIHQQANSIEEIGVSIETLTDVVEDLEPSEVNLSIDIHNPKPESSFKRTVAAYVLVVFALVGFVDTAIIIRDFVSQNVQIEVSR